MKRLGWSGVVLLAVALLVWALWPSEPEHALATPVAEAQPPHELPLPAERETRGGRISGVALRDGLPVANAKVTLKMASTLTTQTLDDGRFLFDDVSPGQAYLSAATDDAASEVLGPLQLSARGALERLTLVLMPAVKIEGQVVDLLTRQPVAQALVTSPSGQDRTDAQGHFSFAGARTQVWLEVAALGYLPRLEWVSLELASRGARLELVLTPASQLRGTVLESGSPVVGATVWAEGVDGPRRGERSINAVTDKEGHFTLQCAAGTLELAAMTPSGVRIKGPRLRLSVGEHRSGIVLDAGDVISAAGRVTRGPQPLSGAQVVAIDAATEAVSAHAITRADGTFRFDALTLGQYLLQVRLGALTAQAGPFTHRGDGQSWVVDIPLGRTLSGRVEPASAGVAVRWRSGLWAGPPAQTLTDASGAFHFEGLPDEWLSLEAEGPAGVASARARAGDSVVLVLTKGEVIVNLQDEQGRPVTDGVLLAKSLDTATVRRQLVLAPDGVTRLDLAQGRWQLSFEVAGRGASSNLEVTVGRSPVEVRLVLESSVSVAGRVTDKRSGLPVASARLEVMSGELGRGNRISVLSDARGEYAFPSVPRSGTVVVSRERFVSQWRRVADGPRWDISLEPAPAAQPGSELNQFEGVGMTLDGRTGAIVVSAVSEGSPAERAGVLAGDQILAVDGTPVAGQTLEAVVQRIRGPSGSPVVLRFHRRGEQFELTVRRRLLTL